MKFAVFALALPALALAQDAPAPTGPQDVEACEAVMSSYQWACARCNSKCAGKGDDEWYEQCLHSVFMTVNYIDSQCWQHGGSNCGQQAVDQVCGAAA